MSLKQIIFIGIFIIGIVISIGQNQIEIFSRTKSENIIFWEMKANTWKILCESHYLFYYRGRHNLYLLKSCYELHRKKENLDFFLNAI